MYHIIQDELPDTPGSDPSTDLASLERTITSLRSDISIAQGTSRTLRSELSTLSSVISKADLQASVEVLYSQRAGLQAKLQDLKKLQGDVKPTTEQERNKVNDDHDLWQKRVHQRTKIAKELWMKCLDLLPDGKTKEELWVSGDKLYTPILYSPKVPGRARL